MMSVLLTFAMSEYLNEVNAQKQKRARVFANALASWAVFSYSFPSMPVRVTFVPFAGISK